MFIGIKDSHLFIVKLKNKKQKVFSQIWQISLLEPYKLIKSCTQTVKIKIKITIKQKCNCFLHYLIHLPFLKIRLKIKSSFNISDLSNCSK